MTADLLADWWQHTVTIQRYTGSGIKGDTYAAGVATAAFVDDKRKLIVNAAGAERVSSMTVFLPAAVDDVPLDSLVTLPVIFGTRTSRVIGVSRKDAGTMGTPNHVEIALL